jgi:hypothetical protein
MGAMEYIEGIEAKAVPDEFGFEILLKGKKHLAYAPLVQLTPILQPRKTSEETCTIGKYFSRHVQWNGYR